jgi:hypothetical protein
MTVFVTGNGCTYGPDERRRFLIVELFLRELKAEDRKIKNWLDEQRLRELRPQILGALWALIKSWSEAAGEPAGNVVHGSFPEWAKRIGGILEHNGFANPCAPSAAPIKSGDTFTADMERLVELMTGKGEKHFVEIVQLCGLFVNMIGDTGNPLLLSAPAPFQTRKTKKPEEH